MSTALAFICPTCGQPFRLHVGGACPRPPVSSRPRPWTPGTTTAADQLGRGRVPEAVTVTVQHVDDTAAVLLEVLGLVAHVDIVHHGPVAAPSQRFEVYALVAGDLIRTYGSSPAEALRHFRQLVHGRTR